MIAIRSQRLRDLNDSWMQPADTRREVTAACTARAHTHTHAHAHKPKHCSKKINKATRRETSLQIGGSAIYDEKPVILAHYNNCSELNATQTLIQNTLTSWDLDLLNVKPQARLIHSPASGSKQWSQAVQDKLVWILRSLRHRNLISSRAGGKLLPPNAPLAAQRSGITQRANVALLTATRCEAGAVNERRKSSRKCV